MIIHVMWYILLLSSCFAVWCGSHSGIAWSRDEWFGHPGQQYAGGGKMRVLNEKFWFSGLNKYYIFEPSGRTSNERLIFKFVTSC